MKIWRHLLYSFIIWAAAFFLILVLLLMPNDTSFEAGAGGSFVGAEYEYSLESHKDNFVLFFDYLATQGGLGEDRYGQPLLPIVLEMFGRSLKIIVPALILSFFIGIAKGIFDYRYRRSKTNVLGRPATWGVLSVPDLALIIGIQITLLTLTSKGWLFHIDLFGHDSIDNVITNVVFLSIYPAAYIANVTFQSLQKEQGLDYIRTAKSKGTPAFVILYKHMLRNGMARIFAHANTMILYILSNLFIIEVFTEYRGAAYYFYESLGSPSQFYVDQLMTGRVVETIAYAFFFTLLILVASIVANLAKAVAVPVKGGIPGE